MCYLEQPLYIGLVISMRRGVIALAPVRSEMGDEP
jgi:hypothetical protein